MPCIVKFADQHLQTNVYKQILADRQNQPHIINACGKGFIIICCFVEKRRKMPDLAALKAKARYRCDVEDQDVAKQ
jgi:hypothetical protein